MKPSLKGKFKRRWIPGYEGLYAADIMGTIWSYKRSLMGMPMVPCLNCSGVGFRYYIKFCRSGVMISKTVAYCVLAAFVGPRPEGMWVCHYDDDYKNNRIGNLRWGTRTDNKLDMLRNGRDGKQKLYREDIPKIRKELQKGKTQQEIADMFGIGRKTISHIKTGANWSHVK